MIRTDLLRGKIAEKGYSQAILAKKIGITPQSFYNKMEKGVFKSDEIYKMIEILGIENPIEVFFYAGEVAQQETFASEVIDNAESKAPDGIRTEG